MPEAALHIVAIRYRCRCCGSTKPVHVSSEELNGEHVVDAHNVRLHRGLCETCGQDRTHVADPEGVDVNLDAARSDSWGGRGV